jgi:hypothetical protein
MAKMTSSLPARRSTRLNISCPVRISGKLGNNVPFAEEAQVVTVSQYGAKLKTRIPLQVGTQIKLEPLRGKNSGIFRVVWVGQQGTPRAGEVGVECMGKTAPILGVYFPDQVSPPR